MAKYLILAVLLIASVSSGLAARQKLKTCIGKIVPDGNVTEMCMVTEGAEKSVAPVDYNRFIQTCPQYREAINREGLCCDKTTFEYYEQVMKAINDLGASGTAGCEYNTQLLLCGLYCAPGQKPHFQILNHSPRDVCSSTHEGIIKLRLYVRSKFAKAWFKSCSTAKTKSGESFISKVCGGIEACQKSERLALYAMLRASKAPVDLELYLADRFGNVGINDGFFYALYPNQLNWAPDADQLPTDLYDKSLRVRAIQAGLNWLDWFFKHFGMNEE